MQRDDLNLTGEVLLSYGMQVFVCVLVASLLLVYSRKPGGGHLRWWSLSWIACAVYVGMAALAISSVYFLRMPATDVRRISFATVAAVAGLFQPYFLWLGTAEALSGVPVEDRLRRKHALGVLVLTGEATAEDAARSAEPPDLTLPSLVELGELLAASRA